MSNDPEKTNPAGGSATADGDPTKKPAPPDRQGEDVESLRSRAEAAERDRDQYVALLKSKQAEFENYQKRQRRLQEEEGRYAHFDFALALLPVLDNLERATAAAEQAGETGPLVQGVGLVEQQLLDVL